MILFMTALINFVFSLQPFNRFFFCQITSLTNVLTYFHLIIHIDDNVRLLTCIRLVSRVCKGGGRRASYAGSTGASV